ncbi:hypothetical protein DFH27DRAFT_78332 [Peziza echinospora]|nr:hypothetical protein DFH27DRAFT_78332 [Peziza echinospora]
MAMMTEFDNCLQSLLSLKPPGISTSKVKELTALCSQNVQSESLLIQKLYMHFKKSPASHKLGILYIVDSVARDYMNQARRASEEYSPTAPDGTYYAGLNRIKDILPNLINDMAQYAPEHKDKINKLFEIWHRGLTFPPEVIAQWRARLATPPTSPISAPRSTTPPGEPSHSYVTAQQQNHQQQQQQYYHQQQQQQAYQDQAQALAQQQAAAEQQAAAAQQQQANAASTASLLQALANMSKPKPTPTPAPSTPNQQQSILPSSQLSQSQAQVPPNIPTPLQQTNGGTQNLAALLPQIGGIPPQHMPQQMPQQPQPQAHQFAQLLQPSMNMVDPNVQQMALLQLLLQQPQFANLPMSQLGPALGPLLGSLNPAAMPAWQQQVPPQMPPTPVDNRFNEDRGSRERGRYSPQPRSPYRRRSRSRSPGFQRRESPPAFRRRSPTYDDYGNEKPQRSGSRDTEHNLNNKGGRNRHGRRGGGSPDRRRRDRSGSPQGRNGRNGGRSIGSENRFDAPDIPSGPKLVEHDPTLPPDHIKVYSRTLFVGGVAGGNRRNTEDELRALFETYGQVQTCIVNQDKRHAFIKMFTRKDALAAKEGMEQYRSPDMTLRTRWGVGFGPRDCSDYTTGVSIIPLDRLTDADRRWMLTATHGGTGGRELVGGIVVEEPDIEIGQGVSSKAMSKRRPTDSGGPTRGPQSSYENSPRRSNRQASPPNSAGVAPPTPNFGSAQPFGQFPYSFPPGAVPAWMFPGQQQQ